jgi:hypothetical protein
MYWRPVNPRPEGEYVDDAVRQRLAPRLWGDGAGTDSVGPDELDKRFIPYLEGLADGGVDGAQELIDAIRKHGTIEIWIAR